MLKALMAFKVDLKEDPLCDYAKWKNVKDINGGKERAEAYIRTKDFKNPISRRLKGHVGHNNEK